jgi:hypothetical protein
MLDRTGVYDPRQSGNAKVEDDPELVSQYGSRCKHHDKEDRVVQQLSAQPHCSGNDVPV